MQLLESTKGYSPLGSTRPANWEERIRETQDYVINNKMKLPSWKHDALIREAMTTSDFPLLFGDILDRSILGMYGAAPRVMGQILQKGTHTDFKESNVFDVQLGAGRMTKKAEKTEYHETNVSEARYHYALSEYGEKLLFSWRVLLSDSLGAFNRIPRWFSDIALNTEEYFLTSLFFGATGPLAAYFSVANGGAAVSALPLTLANLKTAIGAQMKFPNKTSDAPIDNAPMYLMVGPGNYINALEITGTRTEQRTGGAGVAYPVDSVLAKFNLKVINNPMIPFLVTTGTVADTCWALFSDPNKIAAGEVGKLRGQESPNIYIKEPNMKRLGGGDVNPLEGDFDTGSVGYLVRHCIGGCTLDGRAGWASNGQ